jgi:Xaa-Pro dipeptidase
MRSVKGRLEKVFSNTKADAILLMNTKVEDSNFLYLTGFVGGMFEGTIMIVARDKLVLFESPLEYEIAKAQRPKEMIVVKVESFEDVKKGMTSYLSKKVVGINESFIPYSSYGKMKKYSGANRLVDVSRAFNAARSIKDKEEMDNIRTANSITKRSLLEIRKHMKEGITEKKLAAEFDYIMRKNGADELAFGSIISFGKNTALPHHAPDNTRLERNSFVLFDVGAKHKNYCADVSRTFIFKPDRKTEKYRRMADMCKTVKEAQAIALKSIIPGADASKPHIDADKYINGAGHGIYKGKSFGLIHSLGHSIGIDVHDGRIGLAPGMHFKLKEGMVFSDEPGIYVVGFGGVRIEDDVLVTKEGGVLI